MDNPVRIELWGDEIDSIRFFDRESQRSIEKVKEVVIYPATETIVSKDLLDKGLKKIAKESKAQNDKSWPQPRGKPATVMRQREYFLISYLNNINSFQ